MQMKQKNKIPEFLADSKDSGILLFKSLCLLTILTTKAYALNKSAAVKENERTMSESMR